MSHFNTSRRDFLKAAGAGAIGMSMFGCQDVMTSAANGEPSHRPNIIVIMADDMGFSDIGCYGGEVNTPNLNSLANKGLRFTQFYNAARCCPTRASLLTGLYPHQAGMGRMCKYQKAEKPGPYQGYLSDSCVTIAEALQSGGYRSVMSGKWHVGGFRPCWPVDRGFDRYFGLLSGAANYFDMTRTKSPKVHRMMALDGQEYHPPKEGFYMTDAITDHAVNYVQNHDFSAQPLFMYLAYTAPHWPLHALPEDIAKYRDRFRCGWDQIRQERYQRMVQMGIIDPKYQLSPRDPVVPAWESLSEQKKDEMSLKMAIYAAQIDRMDQGIGRVLDQVRRKGQWDNTLILFLSDNGACAETGVFGKDWWKTGGKLGTVDSYQSYGKAWANGSNTPLRMYKHYIHEGGITTPLIAHWPGVIRAHGGLTDQVGHIIDIMTTCCDVAGVSYPDTYHDRPIQPMEGRSLLPVLKGATRQAHDQLAWEHTGNRGIRRGDWKLVSVDKGQWELYNLADDRTECNNLIGRYPERVKELLGHYDVWAKRVGV